MTTRYAVRSLLFSSFHHCSDSSSDLRRQYCVNRVDMNFEFGGAGQGGQDIIPSLSREMYQNDKENIRKGENNRQKEMIKENRGDLPLQLFEGAMARSRTEEQQ